MSRKFVPLANEGPDWFPMDLPWVESPFFEEILHDRQLTPAQALAARNFHRSGFVVVPDAISCELADQAIEQTAPLFRPGVPDGPRSFYRAQDAWREAPAVRQIASSPRILETLEMLYGRRPFPFQTLNFKYGTQQAAHSDQIHFSSLPARFMCGVWIALEDVTADSGPLFFYPGSHRLPDYDLYDFGLSVERPDYGHYERAISSMMRAMRLEAEQLIVPRGSALIWASNLVHGGSLIERPGRTRFSQVTHYFFEGCLFHTPVFSNPAFGEYLHRDPVVDVRTGAPVQQTFNGQRVRTVPRSDGRVSFAFAPTQEPSAAQAHSRATLNQYVESAESHVREWLKSGRLGTRLDALYRGVTERWRSRTQ